MMGTNKPPPPLQMENFLQLVLPALIEVRRVANVDGVDSRKKIDDIRFVFIWKDVGFI